MTANLLLVSVDSLRLDHAPGTTDSQVRASEFERLAADFAFTERCFSVSSATRPVHTSLVTGLYPFEHGILGQYDSHVRSGAPRLFRQFQQAGYRVALFSEAASIFTGIDLGSPCVQLSTRPSEGLAQLRDWLAEPDPSPRCLFVHSWRAHTPYAAADGLALGETAQLLRHGGETIVRERYRVAVQGVFEEQLAPLISGLDLGAWVVVIFGDHGESWTKDELYHGKTLRNSVLRVPLWIHVPYAARSLADEGVVSLVDLFPTLCSLFALPGSAEPLLGIDLLRGPGSEHRRAVAQIRPGLDDDGIVLAPPAPKVAEVRWSIFDGDLKLLGEADDWELVETWSERRLPSPIDSELAGPHRLAWRTLQEESPWTSRALEEGSAVDEPLRERLRALGYLP